MKILIIDDHPIVRAGLRRLIADTLDAEVGEAATAREALQIFREFHPDVVVLDLRMPGISGLEVIGRLKIENPTARIIVLSMHQEPIYATRALQAGAMGFVSKNISPDLLLKAIKRVAAGQSYIQQEIAQELAFANIEAQGTPLQGLSAREFEILRLLGEGCSLKQIADTIGVSYKTVANTAGHIKAKLGVDRTVDLIRVALRNGIVAQ